MIEPALSSLLDRFGLTAASVAEIWHELQSRVRDEVDAVRAEQAAGAAVPVVEFADVAAGSVPAADRDAIHRRGCVVIRNTFDRDLADRWDRDIADYLATNRFDDVFAERYPDAAAGSKIWGIYWSRSQVAARQHPAMRQVRSFLNGFWGHRSDGAVWFDPHTDIGYPDRLRRRAPGVSSRGLPPHSDAVSSGGWRIAENIHVFRPVLAGDVDAYDPWDAAHRTTLDPESVAPSSVFRTFQGWTALSEMRPDDGVLHLIPIPVAAAYMFVRGIAGELGLLEGGPEPAPRRFRADDLLLETLVPIPVVQPGDTVWWHGDIIHSVADASNEHRWGNVMYIGASPRCARNDAYAATMLERFRSGRSPVDFPDEDFETRFDGRATVDDLDEVGRGFFGLATSTTETTGL